MQLCSYRFDVWCMVGKVVEAKRVSSFADIEFLSYDYIGPMENVKP
jgi:hypothetical protein